MSLRLRGRLDPGADSRAIVRWPGVRRPSHAEAEDWVGENPKPKMLNLGLALSERVVCRRPQLNIVRVLQERLVRHRN